jgi:hypothetical protein
MNCENLRDYGLSLGIEYGGLRDWALGQTVQFMHDRDTDTIFIEAYKRGIYFVDEGDHWIADESSCFFRSRPLDDSEARQLLGWWLAKDPEYLKYCDPEHYDPGHEEWLSR